MLARGAAVEAVLSPTTRSIRNGVIGGAVTELQSLIPAGDLRSSTSLLEDRHKRPLTALAPLSRSGDLADFPTDSYFS